MCFLHPRMTCQALVSSRLFLHASPIRSTRFTVSGQWGQNNGQRKETDSSGTLSYRAPGAKHQGSGCSLGAFPQPVGLSPGGRGGSVRGRGGRGKYVSVGLTEVAHIQVARHVLTEGICPSVQTFFFVHRLEYAPYSLKAFNEESRLPHSMMRRSASCFAHNPNNAPPVLPSAPSMMLPYPPWYRTTSTDDRTTTHSYNLFDRRARRAPTASPTTRPPRMSSPTVPP